MGRRIQFNYAFNFYKNAEISSCAAKTTKRKKKRAPEVQVEKQEFGPNLKILYDLAYKNLLTAITIFFSYFWWSKYNLISQLWRFQVPTLAVN